MENEDGNPCGEQYLEGAGQTGVGQTGTSESRQMVKGLQGLDRGEMDFPICLTPVQDPVKWENSKYLLSPSDWILHWMAANGKVVFSTMLQEFFTFLYFVKNIPPSKVFFRFCKEPYLFCI